MEKEKAEESQEKPEEKEEAVLEEVEEEKKEEIMETEETAETLEAEESVEELEEFEEEVEKPPRKEEIGKEIVEERIFTVPLRKAWIAPPKKRAPKAIRILRSFLIKHMKLGAKTGEKLEEEEGGVLIISNEVNERIWRRGIEKPPRKIKVRAEKDIDGNVTVYLAEGD